MNGMTLDNGCSNEGATDDVSNMCNEDVLDKVGVSEEKGPDPLLRSDVGDEEDEEDDEDEEDEEDEGDGSALPLWRCAASAAGSAGKMPSTCAGDDSDGSRNWPVPASEL